MNLIVGGTGFIGGHLAEYFFNEGEISKGTFRKGSHLRIMDQCGIQCLEADPLVKGSLHEAMEMVNVVYNLASPTPDHQQQANYLPMSTTGLLNLLEEADEHGVKDFVHLSTLDVYGFKKKWVGADEVGNAETISATHPYQAAKIQAEKLLLHYANKVAEKGQGEMRVKIVRAAKATGSRDVTLALPILKMIEAGKVSLPAGSASAMSFTHPRDVAKALFRVATAGEGGRIYQVKSFDASFDDLAGGVIEAGGKTLPLAHDGIFSKTIIGPYSVSQVKAAVTLEDQKSWGGISYSPEYDLRKTAQDIIDWQRKEPWLTEE